MSLMLKQFQADRDAAMAARLRIIGQLGTALIALGLLLLAAARQTVLGGMSRVCGMAAYVLGCTVLSTCPVSQFDLDEFLARPLLRIAFFGPALLWCANRWSQDPVWKTPQPPPLPVFYSGLPSAIAALPLLNLLSLLCSGSRCSKGAADNHRRSWSTSMSVKPTDCLSLLAIAIHSCFADDYRRVGTGEKAIALLSTAPQSRPISD